MHFQTLHLDLMKMIGGASWSHTFLAILHDNPIMISCMFVTLTLGYNMLGTNSRGQEIGIILW